MSPHFRINLPLAALLWLASGFAVSRALAGLDVPPAAPDTAAIAAQAAAQVRQEMPAPCAAVPSADTLMGSPGSANCFVPRDAARPTVVQAANVTTAADGTWSVIWARPFSAGNPVVNPLPINTGTLPVLCNVSSRSATGASGKCWQSTSTTISGALSSVVNLLISPFASPAAGAAVMVIAREPTQ